MISFTPETVSTHALYMRAWRARNPEKVREAVRRQTAKRSAARARAKAEWKNRKNGLDAWAEI
jgi:hypothetical protein